MTSPQKIVTVAAAAVIIVAAAGLLALYSRRLGDGTVQVGDAPPIRVTVAATSASRERGLSGRAGLGENEGMLFLFPNAARHSFWMKDMRFPIDILWLENGVLVDLTTDVPVPGDGLPLAHYSPLTPVSAVLEVPAGYAKRHKLAPGMPVLISIDKK